MSQSEDMKNDQKKAVTARLLQANPGLEAILHDLEKMSPADLYTQLEERDGAAKLAVELPKTIMPAGVAEKYKGGQRTWELFGLFFLLKEFAPHLYDSNLTSGCGSRGGEKMRHPTASDRRSFNSARSA